ncbi:MAG: hypothetical protein EZS28_017237, partial [Streblomastix strix]
VRKLIGTVVQAVIQHTPVENIVRDLDQHERKAGAKRAPAGGLTLMKIKYPISKTRSKTINPPPRKARIGGSAGKSELKWKSLTLAEQGMRFTHHLQKEQKTTPENIIIENI